MRSEWRGGYDLRDVVIEPACAVRAVKGGVVSVVKTSHVSEDVVHFLSGDLGKERSDVGLVGQFGCV